MGLAHKLIHLVAHNVENLVTKHQDFMNSQNIKIPEEMKQLPTFYWLPKIQLEVDL